MKDQTSPAACVIWMHGLGADGQDMAGLAAQLPITIPIEHVCMDAPMRPVTLNNRMMMRAWYDIVGMELTDREDRDGILASQQLIVQAIETQLAKGFRSDQIFLAGFSQGGAMALFTGLQLDKPIAGVVALSAYLPLARECHVTLDRATPFFLAGGVFDPLVLPAWTKQSLAKLQSDGFQQIEWHDYPMEHSICADEVGDLANWLTRQINTISQREEQHHDRC
jgi:phospholipase/carboxylesterase